MFPLFVSSPVMLLQYCDQCKEYTLKSVCPVCGQGTRAAHPAKFSPVDPYSKERIEMKRRKGILLTQKPDMKM